MRTASLRPLPKGTLGAAESPLEAQPAQLDRLTTQPAQLEPLAAQPQHHSQSDGHRPAIQGRSSPLPHPPASPRPPCRPETCPGPAPAAGEAALRQTGGSRGGGRASIRIGPALAWATGSSTSSTMRANAPAAHARLELPCNQSLLQSIAPSTNPSLRPPSLRPHLDQHKRTVLLRVLLKVLEVLQGKGTTRWIASLGRASGKQPTLVRADDQQQHARLASTQQRHTMNQPVPGAYLRDAAVAQVVQDLRLALKQLQLLPVAQALE